MPEALNTLMHRYYSQNAVVEASTSVTAGGSQTSPTANLAIATTANLDAGTWEITCYTNIGGTTADVDIDNMVFYIGETGIATILSTLAGATDVFKIRINLPGDAPVSIRAGGSAATTGAIYKATIVANQVSA